MRHETAGDPGPGPGPEPGANTGAKTDAKTGDATGADLRVAGPPVSPAAEGGISEDVPAPRAEGQGRGGVRPDGLLGGRVADGFHERWHHVQAGFVDDPGGAVERADELATEIVNAVGQALADRKRTLAERLDADGEGAPDTERLRLALRDYRDFVDRTLTL